MAPTALEGSRRIPSLLASYSSLKLGGCRDRTARHPENAHPWKLRSTGAKPAEQHRQTKRDVLPITCRFLSGDHLTASGAIVRDTGRHFGCRTHFVERNGQFTRFCWSLSLEIGFCRSSTSRVDFLPVFTGFHFPISESAAPL